MQLFSWPGISPKELLSVEPKSVHKMKKKGNIIEIGLIFSVKDFGKFGWKKNYQKNPGWSSDHKCNYLSFSKNTMCLLKCSFKYYKKTVTFSFSSWSTCIFMNAHVPESKNMPVELLSSATLPFEVNERDCFVCVLFFFLPRDHKQNKLWIKQRTSKDYYYFFVCSFDVANLVLKLF